jgi:hypothetical protein
MLRWIDDQRFVIGETSFLTTSEGDWNDTRFVTFFMSADSTVDRFVVWKSRASTDRFAELVQQLEQFLHCLDAARATFNILLPRLRPEGVTLFSATTRG